MSLYLAYRDKFRIQQHIGYSRKLAINVQHEICNLFFFYVFYEFAGLEVSGNQRVN